MLFEESLHQKRSERKKRLAENRELVYDAISKYPLGHRFVVDDIMKATGIPHLNAVVQILSNQTLDGALKRVRPGIYEVIGERKGRISIYDDPQASSRIRQLVEESPDDVIRISYIRDNSDYAMQSIGSWMRKYAAQVGLEPVKIKDKRGIQTTAYQKK